MAVFAVRFTAAWGLPVTDGSAHVENLVPVYPNRVLDTVCACLFSLTLLFLLIPFVNLTLSLHSIV